MNSIQDRGRSPSKVLAPRVKRSPLTGQPQWGADTEALAWNEAALEQARKVRARSAGDARWTRRRPKSLAVFDDVITGTAAVVTIADFDEPLAARDALAIEAIASQPVGTLARLAVWIEASADRRHWVPLGVAPAIDVALDPALVTAAFGSTTAGDVLLGYVRLRMELSASSGTPSARVRVQVCGRAV